MKNAADVIFDVIATRAFRAGNADLLVRIAKPVEDNGDYRCAYSIAGEGVEKIGYAMGVDSVQALQLAMRKIDADLGAISRRLDVAVSWLDGPPGKSGFL
jgi:hypothetical protein